MIMDDDVSKKQDEIIGGFVNAIARGETLDMARITFLNAGYSQEVVDTAARAILQSNVPQGRVAGTTPVSSGLPLHAQMTPVPVTTSVSGYRDLYKFALSSINSFATMIFTPATLR